MGAMFPSQRLLIGTLPVDVTVKPIKHLHLSVLPPDGAVRISAPEGMGELAVRSYTISKLGWIRRQQERLRSQARESPRLVIERESHQLWGRRLLLAIRERPAAACVEVLPRLLILQVRPGTDSDKRRQMLERWLRSELRREASQRIPAWEEVLGVRCQRLFLQAMTRQWGSCNPAKGTIRLNSQLVHKPISCLDYVLLHELAHLLVHNHGPAFAALLDEHMPDWQERRRLLNQLPLTAATPLTR
jgi:predicted metal-dependent hydrolase